MLRRAFNFASLASAVLLGITLMLSAASFVFCTPDYHLSLSDGFHIGLCTFGDDWVGRVAFYNNAEYGPYRGSLLFLEEPPPMPRRVDFRCRYGICYCDYLWEDGVALWTLIISLCYPIGLFGTLPLIWGWQNQSGIIRLVRTLCATKSLEDAASNEDDADPWVKHLQALSAEKRSKRSRQSCVSSIPGGRECSRRKSATTA